MVVRITAPVPVEVVGRRAVPEVDVADDAELLQPVERAVDGGAVGVGVARSSSGSYYVVQVFVTGC